MLKSQRECLQKTGVRTDNTVRQGEESEKTLRKGTLKLMLTEAGKRAAF